MVYEIARRCYPALKNVALWSGWLWALYPAAMQYAVHWVWDMTLTTFLFTWILVIALRVRGIGEPPNTQHSTTARWAAFGLLWGLICLSNSTLVLFLPVCAIWMLLGPAKQGQFAPALGQAALAAILFIACMTPWVWRNWTVMHAFIVTRGNLGAEMYQSVLPEHNGFPWGTTVSYVDSTPDYQSYKNLGEVAYVKQKGEFANAYIRTHRRWFVELFVKRIYFYWVGVPHPIEKSVFIEAVRELNYSFLSYSGLLGLALSIRRKYPVSGSSHGHFSCSRLPTTSLRSRPASVTRSSPSSPYSPSSSSNPPTAPASGPGDGLRSPDGKKRLRPVSF